MSTSPTKALWHRAQNDSARATYQRQSRAQSITIGQRLPNVTDRERQVLHLIADDLHNKEIASRLGLSVKTIEFHKTRIFDRLGVAGAISAVRLCGRNRS